MAISNIDHLCLCIISKQPNRPIPEVCQELATLVCADWTLDKFYSQDAVAKETGKEDLSRFELLQPHAMPHKLWESIACWESIAEECAITWLRSPLEKESQLPSLGQRLSLPSQILPLIVFAPATT
jgi:hypothetical protein